MAFDNDSAKKAEFRPPDLPASSLKFDAATPKLKSDDEKLPWGRGGSGVEARLGKTMPGASSLRP